MSNLIITIISIALVAVATAMGIYYGGSAYENATAQAAANQMISDAQQIAAAYQMYSNANGGTLYEPTVGHAIDFQFLVGGEQTIFSNHSHQTVQLTSYLNALPQVPSLINTGDGTVIDNSYACGSGSYDFDNDLPCTNIIAIANPNPFICNNCLQVNQPTQGLPIVVTYPMYGNVANGYASVTATQLKVCQDIANKARGQGAPIDTTYFIDQSTSLFDCAAEDPSIGSAGTYDFVYRIF